MNKNILFFPDRAIQHVILVGQKPLDCYATIGFPPREAGKINSRSSIQLKVLFSEKGHAFGNDASKTIFYASVKEITKNAISFLMLNKLNKQTKKLTFYSLNLSLTDFAVCCQHLIAHQYFRGSDVGDIQSFCKDFLCNRLTLKHFTKNKKDVSRYPNFKYTEKKSVMKCI